MSIDGKPVSVNDRCSIGTCYNMSGLNIRSNVYFGLNTRLIRYISLKSDTFEISKHRRKKSLIYAVGLF